MAVIYANNIFQKFNAQLLLSMGIRMPWFLMSIQITFSNISRIQGSIYQNNHLGKNPRFIMINGMQLAISKYV
jgi:hypothetical protein